jgi:hypothetical protein
MIGRAEIAKSNVVTKRKKVKNFYNQRYMQETKDITNAIQTLKGLDITARKKNDKYTKV